MTMPNYDQFLANVLRSERVAFGFVAHPDYQAEFPGELVWVLVRALVREKALTLKQAAQVVLDFTERNGEHIPYWLGGQRSLNGCEIEAEEAKPPPRFLN